MVGGGGGEGIVSEGCIEWNDLLASILVLHMRSL